jgi:hypothetical protein
MPTGGVAPPPLLLFDFHLLLENEWNALKMSAFQTSRLTPNRRAAESVFIACIFSGFLANFQFCM